MLSLLVFFQKMVDFLDKKEYYFATLEAIMEILEKALAALGIDSGERWGWNHGAPPVMWLAFGSAITLAVGTLVLAACAS